MKLTRIPPRKATAYARGEPAWRCAWNEEKNGCIGAALSVPGGGPDIDLRYKLVYFAGTVESNGESK